MIFDEERGLIFSGGDGCFAVTDVASNLELIRLYVKGRIFKMRFGPSKRKIILCTQSDDGVGYYYFDVQNVGRFYHEFPG